MDQALLQLGFLFAIFDPVLVGLIVPAPLEPKFTNGASMVMFRGDRPCSHRFLLYPLDVRLPCRPVVRLRAEMRQVIEVIEVSKE